MTLGIGNRARATRRATSTLCVCIHAFTISSTQLTLYCCRIGTAHYLLLLRRMKSAQRLQISCTYYTLSCCSQRNTHTHCLKLLYVLLDSLLHRSRWPLTSGQSRDIELDTLSNRDCCANVNSSRTAVCCAPLFSVMISAMHTDRLS
jgi:hypothetical protein